MWDCQVIDLMEENETNYAYERFVAYKGLLKEISEELGIEVQINRYPIRDLSVPSAEEMMRILDHIYQALKQKLPVYVHCWGVSSGGTGMCKKVECSLINHLS